MTWSALDKASTRITDPRVAWAAKRLLQAAAIQELSERLAEPLKGSISRRAEESIEAVLRALGQTPPSPLIPNPWPQPSTLALGLAVDLTVFSNTYLQPGFMQKAVQKIATRLVEAAYDTGP